MFTGNSRLSLAVILTCLMSDVSVGQVLFEDGFDDDTIDAAKWRLDDKPFETGGGDYEAVEADGVLTISGKSTQNWWGGLALATIPTFRATADAPLTFEVERVMHEGVGSSTRTSIWITDAQRQNFVLFSHNANESGWTYNKRVGDADDNATNRGINIGEFDDRDSDFGQRLMGMEANGETVQLFLDEEPGPVVNFPFSEGIVFEIAVYAREGSGNQDTITGVFDNVFVTGPATDCVSLTPPFTEALKGETPELTLEIPPDAPRPATVTITSSAPDVAIPSGAVDGVLTVTFNAGDEPARVIPVEIPGEGLAEFTLTSDMPLCDMEPIGIFVPAVLLEDDFEDEDFNERLWREDLNPFEDGDGAFDFLEEGGIIKLSGEAEEAFWPGIAIMSQGTFNPTPERPVRFQIDMKLTSLSMGTFRSGVWIADCDREEWIFFSFIGSGDDWTANSTTTFVWPRDGEGRLLRAYECCGFADLNVTGRVELLANGERVWVIMDGIEGGSAPFQFDNVSFGFGAYAAGLDQFILDSVDAEFDNARVIGQASTIGEGCGGPVGPVFKRGDSDDSGGANITDAIGTLDFLFGGRDALPCLEAADIDNDGTINVTDPIRLLNFLFGGGGEPPEAPGDTCGPDPAEPTLDCVYTNC